MSTVTNHSRYLSSHLDADRQTYPVMRKRRLGNTGIAVGEIGVGTAALQAGGMSGLPDAELRYTLSAALDMQASLIDVASTGGEDRPLRQFGFAMQRRRHQAQVCLRVAGGPAEVRKRTETALRALDTDHVDVLLWDHPAFKALAGQGGVWTLLEAMKKEGKARSLGASLDRPEELRAALEQTPAEVLQFPLNVFEQSNAAVLDAAAAKGLGLIAVKALDSGWLSGRFGALHLFLDERRRWSMEDKSRRAAHQKAFEVITAKSGTTSAQAALQFVLSFPQLSCAAVGVSAWQQVVGNVDAASAAMDEAVVRQLRGLWAEALAARPLGL
jgi:aryl-alcohol dehydrogenase-like predicted oxidoreductase